MKSCLTIPNLHDFSMHNIPFGVIAPINNISQSRCATILGDFIIDLSAMYELGYFKLIPELTQNVFQNNSINDFMQLGSAVTSKVRKRIQSLFSIENIELLSQHKEKIIFNKNKFQNLLPIQVSDVVDFYSNLNHATNVGKMFRDAQNPLLPNWKYLPIGYHGRSRSVVVSGTPILRPLGQIRPNENESPIYTTSRQLDFELEMAFITSQNTKQGQIITPDNAKDFIFGMTLFNDWSARDIQKWEYVPLGPFLGKSFASSLSPWVVTLDALEPFSLPNLEKDVEELSYLKCNRNGLFDIQLEVTIQTKEMEEPFKICKTNYNTMYWNLYQQLAHMSSNGSPIGVGDVYGSGTISGQLENSFGSLLELCWKGTKPLKLPNGTVRNFLEDGDTITFNGFCEKDGIRIGFGEVTGTIIKNEGLCK